MKIYKIKNLFFQTIKFLRPEKNDGFSQMSPFLLESALDEAGCKSDSLIELMKR